MKTHISKIAHLLVGVLSFLIILSWFLSWEVLLSISSDWVTMKLTTATLFLLSSCLYFRTYNMFICPVILMVSTYILITGPIAFSLETSDHIMSTAPDMPSIATLLCFILLTIPSQFSRALVISLSTLALIGYMVSFPLLYFYIPDYSTAMAIHTSIFFLLLSGSQYYENKNS